MHGYTQQQLDDIRQQFAAVLRDYLPDDDADYVAESFTKRPELLMALQGVKVAS